MGNCIPLVQGYDRFPTRVTYNTEESLNFLSDSSAQERADTENESEHGMLAAESQLFRGSFWQVLYGNSVISHADGQSFSSLIQRHPPFEA